MFKVDFVFDIETNVQLNVASILVLSESNLLTHLFIHFTILQPLYP